MQVAFPDPDNPKSRLRAAMRRMLRDRPADSTAVLAELESWLAGHPDVSTIAVFAALPGEVNLVDAVARHPERRWAYPRVEGADLCFHQVEDPSTGLVPRTLGIREPRPDLPLVAVPQIDAFLCPGLAFDARGGRLGRGRGFYDRALAEARPDAWKIGICFPCQWVDDTFPEPHDVAMDLLISGFPPP